jgi:hypothetical protein
MLELRYHRIGEAAMESAEILDQARVSDEAPHGWIVLPLLRNKVAIAIAGWIIGAIIGLGLFALMASVMIPNNFQNGPPAAIFSAILLGVVLFIGIGSIWATIGDIGRLRNADKYLIVITPEDFVKQEGKKIIHVPLRYVRHVTARGVPPPDRTAPSGGAISEVPRPGDNLVGFLFGRGFIPTVSRQRRKRMRTPTTLAFLDARTDTEVVVATDASFGDTFMIAALLKQYANNVQQIV